MTQFFSPKDPEETIVLAVDFTAVLDVAETISSAVWLISREDASEVTTAMLVGTTDISGAPIIRQKVTGGTAQGTYIHRAKVVTSASRTLVHGVRQVVSYGA